jgi:hypothetical protein
MLITVTYVLETQITTVRVTYNIVLVCEWLAFVLCFQKVQSSNVGPEIGYYD